MRVNSLRQRENSSGTGSLHCFFSHTRIVLEPIDGLGVVLENAGQLKFGSRNRIIDIGWIAYGNEEAEQLLFKRPPPISVRQIYSDLGLTPFLLPLTDGQRTR